jgi:uncharacterized protein YutE (UPF0331/DUF86 family)
MKYNGIIQRKLALLDQQVTKLEEHTKNLSYKEFEESWVYRSMAERALQVSAEIMIDIAERIIALENAGPVATASDAVKKLQQLGILKDAEVYKSIIRFRNLIVHEYEIVDPEIIYKILKDHLSDFRRFRDEIDEVCIQS